MLKRGRKAQGLSIQQLVLMALVVLVLVIMGIFFISRYTRARTELKAVTNPLEYKAACLAKYKTDNDGYNECVKRCEDAAKANQPREECSLKDEDEKN